MASKKNSQVKETFSENLAGALPIHLKEKNGEFFH